MSRRTSYPKTLIHTYKYHPTNANAGWPSFELFLISISYSCLLARKNGFIIELYSDEQGVSMLIEDLGLPYNNHHLLFPESTPFSDNALFLFPVFKIQSYAIQQRPFLHIDNDVFIWDPDILPDDYAPLVAQNPEVGLDFYKVGLKQMYDTFNYIPDVLRNRDLSALKAYNAGIIGGKDLNFFKDFHYVVEDFVLHNLEKFRGDTNNNFLPIVEQLLFSLLAEKKEMEVQCLFDETITSYRYQQLSQIDNAPIQQGYIHPVSSNKNSPAFCEKLIKKFRVHFPEYYKTILNYCHGKKQVKLSFASSEYYVGILDGAVFAKKITTMARSMPRTKILVHYCFENDMDISVGALFNQQARSRVGIDRLLRLIDIMKLEQRVWLHVKRQCFNNYGVMLKEEEENYQYTCDFWQNFDSENTEMTSIKWKLNPLAVICESRWQWQAGDPMDNFKVPPAYFRTAVLINIYQGTIEDFALDNLDMVLLEVFEQPTSMLSGIKKAATYFNEKEDSSTFTKMCFDRLRRWSFSKVLINDDDYD